MPRAQARAEATETVAESSPPDEPPAEPALDAMPAEPEPVETAPEPADETETSAALDEQETGEPTTAESGDAAEPVDAAPESAPEPVDETETPAAADQPETGEPTTAESGDDGAPDEPEAEEPEPDEPEAEEPIEPVLVAHRPAGRVLKTAAVLAAVLFVAAAAFSGAAAQRYLLDRAEVHVKFDVAKTAADAITTLFTYTPEDLEQLPRRSSGFLSGDFAADYKRYIDSIVAPNKQAQVSNQTQVLGAAVESLNASEATALVYTNSVSTSPLTKGLPSLQYRSYRLDLKRDQRRWFVTRMVPITTLDLTPRL